MGGRGSPSYVPGSVQPLLQLHTECLDGGVSPLAGDEALAVAVPLSEQPFDPGRRRRPRSPRPSTLNGRGPATSSANVWIEPNEATILINPWRQRRMLPA